MPHSLRLFSPRLLASFAVLSCLGMPVFADAPADEKKSMAPRECAKPVYPRSSIRNMEQGTVKLGFLIAVTGQVVGSRIETSSGFRELDVAARDAIALCKFKPMYENGKPVEAWHSMSYVWSLE